MYKDSSDFRNEYPNGYSKDGDIYDGNNNHIGYVTGDGDFRITESGANQGQLYHNKQQEDKTMLGEWLVFSAIVYAAATIGKMFLGG